MYKALHGFFRIRVSKQVLWLVRGYFWGLRAINTKDGMSNAIKDRSIYFSMSNDILITGGPCFISGNICFIGRHST